MNRYPFRPQQGRLDPGPGIFLWGGLLVLFLMIWPFMLHGIAEIGAIIVWYGSILGGLIALAVRSACHFAVQASPHRPPARLPKPEKPGLPDLRKSGEFSGRW